MNDLVSILSAPDQPVVVGGIDPSAADFVQRLADIKHVPIRLTETRGGTELSFPLDNLATDLSGADLPAGNGVVHVKATSAWTSNRSGAWPTSTSPRCPVEAISSRDPRPEQSFEKECTQRSTMIRPPAFKSCSTMRSSTRSGRRAGRSRLAGGPTG